MCFFSWNNYLPSNVFEERGEKRPNPAKIRPGEKIRPYRLLVERDPRSKEATASLACGAVRAVVLVLAAFRGAKANRYTATNPTRHTTTVVFSAFSEGSPRSSRGPRADNFALFLLMSTKMGNGEPFSTVIFPVVIIPRELGPNERRVGG